MTPSYGLNLAGYSTKGSALAVAEKSDDTVNVTILDGHCFGESAAGTACLTEKTTAEIKCLQQLLDAGSLYVDVPIDLQGLPCPNAAEYVWQLTKRPVDQAFGALRPLADRIGSHVARMHNLWRLLKSAGNDPLGTTLFETYPAASLSLSKHDPKGYKGHAVWNAHDWAGVGTKKEADQEKNDKLASLLNCLKWQAQPGFLISNDEFDAALCALCGFGETLSGDELDRKINKNITATLSHNQTYCAPTSYVLLSSVPSAVSIDRRSLAPWFSGGCQ